MLTAIHCKVHSPKYQDVLQHHFVIMFSLRTLFSLNYLKHSIKLWVHILYVCCNLLNYLNDEGDKRKLCCHLSFDSKICELAKRMLPNSHLCCLSGYPWKYSSPFPVCLLLCSDVRHDLWLWYLSGSTKIRYTLLQHTRSIELHYVRVEMRPATGRG